MAITKELENGRVLLFGILSLGILGVLFLIIFGNLATVNFGFANDSVTKLNETGFINTSGYVLAGANFAGASNFNITNAINVTSGANIASGNWSLNTANGSVLNASAVVWNSVIFNYTYTRTGASESNTQSSIGNLTTGAVTYFGFSNTWFTLGAVVLLIAIVFIIIKTVNKMSGGKDSDNNKGPDYT